MTPGDASYHPEKNIYYFKSTEATPKFKDGDCVKVADKRNIFSKAYTSNLNRELFNVNKVLEFQTPSYKNTKNSN